MLRGFSHDNERKGPSPPVRQRNVQTGNRRENET
jgi:hypothetical protein